MFIRGKKCTEMAKDIYFFFKIFLKMWTVFKGFIEFVTVLLPFYAFGFLALRYVEFSD